VTLGSHWRPSTISGLTLSTRTFCCTVCSAAPGAISWLDSTTELTGTPSRSDSRLATENGVS
jgi:hypothetical protein